MENHRIISFTTKVSNLFWVFIFLTIAFTTSARFLDEEPSELPAAPEASNPVTTPATSPGVAATNSGVAAGTSGATLPNTDPHHTLTFFMHDILGGSNPSARAVTGIVNNPAVNGQLPFVKPNGANLPINNGVEQNANNNGLINNNNIPFLTGLGGTTQAVLQNSGNNMFNNVFNFPAATGGQLPSGSTLQQLMYGTITVIDDELTEAHELGSGFLGKAQGFYVVSSVDGTSQTMAFTTMFQSGHYVDSLSFFGVHRTGVSESQLAIMGGTGKYVNAKGFAIVKTIPASATTQNDTDGVETVLEFAVYVSY
ncbi:Disease resistance-responsive family protein [Tripterygium wilfordii]|uniref:Dirigent protein n=1 Tax=Tripterygium wilfordii TaxID=458696 RepID=A0A7J7D9A2_TRIWF|nr:dirigent protein 25-like [Tripterygium wilfordii]KAF5742646.1 Disease resistance-responsive family protein [Tripterygium wilfordii]